MPQNTDQGSDDTLIEKSLALVGAVMFAGKTLYEAAAEQGLDPRVAFEMINVVTDTLFGVLEDHEELAA